MGERRGKNEIDGHYIWTSERILRVEFEKYKKVGHTFYENVCPAFAFKEGCLFASAYFASAITPTLFSFALCLSYIANIPANRVPEMECHVQDTAQMIADSE